MEDHDCAGCTPEFVVPRTWADRVVQNYMDSQKKGEGGPVVNKRGVKVPMTWVDEVLMDAINPQHYQQYKGLEVIDLTEQMNFNKGNAVKYVTRAGTKPGADEVEDLKKAKWYIEREIRRVENEGSSH